MKRTINISISQVESIAQQAYQEGAHSISAEMGMESKVVHKFLKENMEKEITSLSLSAFKRYSGSYVSPLNENALEDSIKLFNSAREIQNDAEVQMNAYFNTKFTSFIRSCMYKEAQELAESLPECQTRTDAIKDILDLIDEQ